MQAHNAGSLLHRSKRGSSLQLGYRPWYCSSIAGICINTLFLGYGKPISNFPNNFLLTITKQLHTLPKAARWDAALGSAQPEPQARRCQQLENPN